MIVTPTVKRHGTDPWDWRVRVRYRNGKGQVREKTIANRPVSRRDEDWQVVTEEWAKRNALDVITWGWRMIPGWGGFRIRLSERPDDVLDVRIVRRHLDDSYQPDRIEHAIRTAAIGGQ